MREFLFGYMAITKYNFICFSTQVQVQNLANQVQNRKEIIACVHKLRVDVQANQL